jgi:hypothetical protein
MDTKISDAWLVAAGQLGIRVTAPFQFKLDDGQVVEVEAFLPDFGGPNGAVLVGLMDEEESKQANTKGYFVSALGSDYQQFDDELFRMTLDDWGWYGPADQQPSWHAGPCHP